MYQQYSVKTVISAVVSAGVLAFVILGVGPTKQSRVGVAPVAAGPLSEQDIALEFGESTYPSALTLCGEPHPVIVFERPLEEQIYHVMQAYPMGLTDELRRLTATTIVEESERHGLDPWLVVGLIRVESGFYNYSVSNKDAMGLMQLLPYVGQSVAEEIGVRWNGPETLFHPVKNVKIGTAYLAHLQERFGGDREKALQAYNLGPTRLARWMRSGWELPTEYSSAVESFYQKFHALADVPSADLRGAVASAERRYTREKRARVMASLATAAPEEAPGDLADALEAGVPSVDEDAEDPGTGQVPDSRALRGAAYDDEPDGAGAAFESEGGGAAYHADERGGGSAILAPPVDQGSHGLLDPPGFFSPR